MTTTSRINKLDAALTAAGFKFAGGWAYGSETDDAPDYTTLKEARADLRIGQDMHVAYTDSADKRHWVLLIPTNGEDMISDYSVSSEAFEVAVGEVSA